MTPGSNNETSLKVDAAIAEYLEIAEQGVTPDREAFLTRHAEIADHLREFLADYGAIKPPSSNRTNDKARTNHRPVQPATGRSISADAPPVKANDFVITTCPNGHRLQVSSNLVGRSAKCPKCANVFIVPTSLDKPVQDNREKTPRELTVQDDTLIFKGTSADDASVAEAAELTDPSKRLSGEGQRFGQFELVELLGEGGFGAVYRAHNAQLDRDVALKLPRPGALGDREEVARFLREAQAAAQLHHPNIVAVYDAGQVDGTYYIASAYIPGKTLRQKLDEPMTESSSSSSPKAAADHRQISHRETATLISKLASALNYAHQKGIFHRDVKPANIMLDANGQPHLMDFGLARRLEGDTLRTMEGIKLGTPAYMSPEQAKGKSHLADARSDLWSLGVIMYELLVGHLPFDSKQLENLLVDILQREPDPPRKSDNSIPKDLETICLKCLAKEPVRRYPTCQHLADELDRWLRGEPISARPVGPLERSWRWANRRPAIAALAGMLLAVLAAVVVIAPIVAVQQSLLRRKAGELLTEKELMVKQLDTTLEQRDQSIKDRDRTIKERDQLLKERDAAIALQTQSLKERDDALQQQKEAMQIAEQRNAALQQSLKERDEAVAGQKEAQELAEERNEPLQDQRARDLMQRAAAQYRAGKLFDAIALAGGAYRIAPVGRSLHDSARELIAGWSSQIGQPIRHNAGVFSAVFSRDGNRVLTGSEDRTIRFSDGGTGTPLVGGKELDSAVRAVAFSPDGAGYLTATHAGTIQFWGKQGATRFDLDQHPIYTVAFSPDASALVVASDSGLARKWDIRTNLSVDFKHAGKVYGAVFSPDSKLVLTASADGTAQLWDAVTGLAVGAPLTHPKEVSAVAFHPDGRSFITGCFDGVVRQWSVKGGNALGKPLQHKGRIFAVDYSPDGHTIITGCEDGAARLWDAKSGKQISDPLLHGGWVVAVSFNPDGHSVLTASGDGTARLWPFPTVQPMAEPIRTGGAVPLMAFSNDGKTAATVGADNNATLWDCKTGKAIGELHGHDKAVKSLAFSADGRILVTTSEDMTARLWDAKTQQPLGEPLETEVPVTTAVFSPDGATLFTGGTDGSAQFWNTTTSEPLGKLTGHKQFVTDAVFSTDGKTILTGSYDLTARLWDTKTGNALGQPIKHPARVLAVALSPDGHVVLTGCADQTARLWNAETGKALCEPLRHGDKVVAVAFSPDGRLVVTGGEDGRARWWDATTGLPPADSIRHESSLLAVKFRPDGQTVLTGSADGIVRLWKVPQPMPDNAVLIDAWVQTHARSRVDDQGVLAPIDAAGLSAAQAKLKSFRGILEQP